MNNVDVRLFQSGTTLPLLVLLDPVAEYVERGRPLGFADAGMAVENCQKLLHHARREQIPVAFLRLRQRGPLFHPKGDYSRWIEGLSPRGSEMVFEREWPSAFSSPEFCELMNEGWGRDTALAGFTGTVACLSTIVEGISKQHRFSFLHDASHSHRVNDNTEADAHQMGVSIASIYCRVESTENWMRRTSNQEKSVCAIRGVEQHG